MIEPLTIAQIEALRPKLVDDELNDHMNRLCDMALNAAPLIEASTDRGAPTVAEANALIGKLWAEHESHQTVHEDDRRRKELFADAARMLKLIRPVWSDELRAGQAEPQGLARLAVAVDAEAIGYQAGMEEAARIAQKQGSAFAAHAIRAALAEPAPNKQNAVPHCSDTARSETDSAPVSSSGAAPEEAPSEADEPYAWIEHHKGGNNLVWSETTLPCTPLYKRSGYVDGEQPLPCGHHASLLVKSVESDYQYCDLCECRKQRNDAEEMERTYRARLNKQGADAARYRFLRQDEHTFAVFMPRQHGHIAFMEEGLDARIDEAIAASRSASQPGREP